MSTPYLGEIRMVAFRFAPQGWALCNGQSLSISQNAALFSLLGTVYGGDGIQTFQLPNLQARMPVHPGNGFVLGYSGGEASHTLTYAEIPVHSHQAYGVKTNATSASAAGNVWAASSLSPYAGSWGITMGSAALQQAGGGQPHDNMAPYLTLNFVIALQGIFPSRN